MITSAITVYTLVVVFQSFIPDREPNYERFSPDYATYAECKYWKELIDKRVKTGKVWAICIKRTKTTI